MKLLLATGIYPPEIGGPASFTAALARELFARDIPTEVVTYGDAKTKTSEDWNVHVVSRRGSALMRYVRYAMNVRRHAKKSNLVFLQGPVSEGLPGTFGARLAKKPTVLKVVGDYAWEMHQQSTLNPELLDEFLKRRHSGSIGILENIERRVAKKAAHIIVPSAYLKSVVERWGIPSEKISIIYNTIRPLPKVSSREVLRQELQLTDKHVILTAVRAVPWKGGDFLIKLLPELPDNTLLAIAGDGPSLQEWKALAHTLGVSSRVRFLGRIEREDLARWYTAADVFALATGYEGYPHVVVEAVSVGLPCIVSDKGGNPETAQLYPEYVTVSPYLDMAAWKNALAQSRPHLTPAAIPAFRDVAAQYLQILSPYAKL